MRAVNLIPVDERRNGRPALSDLNPLTLGVLGGLLAVLVVVTALVLIGNATNSRRDDAARTQAQAAAVQRKADALTPTTSVLQARERSLAAARALAGTRYDWSRLLGSVSRQLPRDAALTNFNGKLGAAGAAPDGAAPASATASAPSGQAGATVALTGCAASLDAIARLMERMRSIDGVLDVTFTTSSKEAAGGSADCRFPRSFELSLGLQGPPAAFTGGS